MTIGAFIIHLERATERRANVDALIEALPVPAKILPAVDAKTMSDADRAAVYQAKGRLTPRYPFQLTHGEIACFLSHRKAWQEMVRSGHDAGLVLEDDSAIDPVAFEAAWKLATRFIHDRKIIQFLARPLRGPVTGIARNGSAALLLPETVSLGAVCSLYSAEAAERLLKLTETFDRPVDTFIQMKWVTGLHPAVLKPSGISEISATLGGTTIQHKKKPFAARLSREWSRWRYRANVRRLSKTRA